MSDANAFEASIDEVTGTAVISEVDPSEVEGALADNPTFQNLLPAPVFRALASWAEVPSEGRSRNRGIFQRNKFVTPGKIYEQMAMGYDALDDDVVGNVADTSEAIAFQKVTFECEDKDQENVWNQIGRDLDLDTWVRQAWRELFTVSQFYGVRWWGTKNYRVKGKRDKRESRKEFEVVTPVGLGLLDPTRVVPVKPDIFGNHQLAWIATEGEMSLWEKVRDGEQTDEMVKGLFLGPYKPSESEAQKLSKEGVEVDKLMLLNPLYTFRHTLTKSPYERWARIRMKSIFPILDLKHQLREMDRAFLLGGINFLVLVTRGTDNLPTTRDEVASTQAQIRAQAKSPVIVSDHRISVEIITPEVDHILDRDKWAVLDERLMMRLWGTYQLSSETSSRETSVTLGRVIARGLSNRRHMLKRAIEREIIRPVVDHPANEGFNRDCKIEFAPRRMELDTDEALMTVLQELRDRGDLSRETLLREFNFDQDLEARRREHEDERYKDVFEPVNVPFDSPNRTTPGGSGRQGGRPAGKPAPNDKGGGNK
jgi:hypothetical protein